jgi:hypothetical protein
MLNFAAIMTQTFDAVNQHSVDGILNNWSATGTYDNPTVGPPATGMAQLRQAMTTLIENVRKAGISLRVNRTTCEGNRVIAEWHAEPPNGRRGVHVAEFNSEGKLVRVTVYPRG